MILKSRPNFMVDPPLPYVYVASAPLGEAKDSAKSDPRGQRRRPDLGGPRPTQTERT